MRHMSTGKESHKHRAGVEKGHNFVQIGVKKGHNKVVHIAQTLLDLESVHWVKSLLENILFLLSDFFKSCLTNSGLVYITQSKRGLTVSF